MKRKGSVKTRERLFKHTRRRALERYGFVLNAESYREMVNFIQTNQAKFIHRESRNRTHWIIDYQCHKFICVYNKELNCIATILPESAIHDYGLLP